MLNDNNISSTLSTGASADGPNGILVAIHVIIVVLSPVAIVGNAVVLTVIWKRSFQRTPFHILLSVLAFSDLCTGIATSIMSIPYLYNHTFETAESAIGILCETYLVSLTILVITLMSMAAHDSAILGDIAPWMSHRYGLTGSTNSIHCSTGHLLFQREF